jgi:aldehyde dehydrogenase
MTVARRATGSARETRWGTSGIWVVAASRRPCIRAGRVWTNCYHLYPAHAAFGGYKQSGSGREMHKMALDQYQQTKSVLVSYGPKALGLF